MPSSISNSEFQRPIPDRPWPRLLLVAVVLTTVATAAWEIRCRSAGYVADVNDSMDLWAQRRAAVKPDSVVVIGDSRPLFDTDLDELERGLGKRPIQLSMWGSCAYPILADLAADENFRGTVICSVVPLMYFAPAGFLVERSEAAVKRYRTQTLAQRWGQELGMVIEERLAFLNEDDLTLSDLLKKLPIPNRANAQVGPPLPGNFSTMVNRERRVRMIDACARPGPLQTSIKEGWIALCTPPPPPSFVPKEAFLAGVGKAIEARFKDSAAAVKKIQARGGNVIFVRYPMTGKLKEHEDRLTPRAGPWTQLLAATGAPGIYFEDHPELASFDCPEWSHLSGPDSVEFTKRLVPHLKKALGQ